MKRFDFVQVNLPRVSEWEDKAMNVKFIHKGRSTRIYFIRETKLSYYSVVLLHSSHYLSSLSLLVAGRSNTYGFLGDARAFGTWLQDAMGQIVGPWVGGKVCCLPPSPGGFRHLSFRSFCDSIRRPGCRIQITGQRSHQTR